MIYAAALIGFLLGALVVVFRSLTIQNELVDKLRLAREENEDMMREDYWAGRAKIAQDRLAFADMIVKRNMGSGLKEISTWESEDSSYKDLFKGYE